MIPGIIASKTSRESSLTVYLYVIPFMVLPSGTIVKMRNAAIVLAMSDKTDVANVIRTVIDSNTNENQRYTGLLLSYRGVTTGGVVSTYRTDVILLDETGTKVVKNHHGNVVKVGKLEEKKISYTINVSRDTKLVPTKEADFTIVPKTGENLTSLAKDILSVCMLLSPSQDAFKRMMNIVGMRPSQGTIINTVKHQDINMRSIGVRSVSTGVSYVFNLWGENY